MSLHVIEFVMHRNTYGNHVKDSTLGLIMSLLFLQFDNKHNVDTDEEETKHQHK